MKKFFSIVLLLLLVVAPVMEVNAATTKKTTTTKITTPTEEAIKDGKVVTVHVFYSSTCGFCKTLREYLSELSNDKTYGKLFEVVEYEVSDSFNSELKSEVDAHYNNPTNTGVPVYVIGDDYYDGYEASTYNDRIKASIKKAYESGKTYDAIEKLSSKLKKDSSAIGYVILGIVAVIIVAVIVSSSKNKYYEDEEVETEEVKTKEVETKKAETKSEKVSKSAPKKTTTKKTKTSTTTKKKTK